MSLTVRLDTETDQSLTHAAKLAGVTKSEYVRRCLISHLEKESKGGLAWELGKDLFGKHCSGRSDVSANKKAAIKEVFDAKRRNR